MNERLPPTGLPARNRLRAGRAVLFLAAATALSLASCRLYRLERNLDPENREFLSQVRYIITSQERKIFLELPPGEREAFKEAFWKRRDPDPQTEENEFKMEYMARLLEADELFRNEPRPGHLTDRGRIYVLFGPPRDKIVDTMRFEGGSQEIWYYGSFPVVFVDTDGTGVFKLVTYNLTELRSLNIMYMHELNKEQERFQRTIQGEERSFDFEWKIRRSRASPGHIKGTVYIQVPYAALWFKEAEDDLETTLELRLELKDAESRILWEHHQDYPIHVPANRIHDKAKKSYSIEIPFSASLGEVRSPGKILLMHALLRNRTGGDEMRKVWKLHLPD